MKKTITIVLMLFMVFSLTACSAPSDLMNTQVFSRAQESQDKEQVYETEDEEAEEAVEEHAVEVVEETSSIEETAEYSGDEIVIVDDENCTMIITGINPDGDWGMELSIYLENKTDKKLMFAWSNVSVNGYLVDSYWANEVAAGKKLNGIINFYTDDFDQCNITSADEIEFDLMVYDSDDWSADYLVDEIFTLYPTGLDADSVVVPERTVVDGEQVVVDNENLTFIIESVDPNADWGYTLNCYIENKTDMNLMLSWDDVSVNDYMVNPYWVSEVPAGKREYSEIRFYSEDFEANGISDVQVIEYRLSAYEIDDWLADDWSADDIFNEVMKYMP